MLPSVVFSSVSPSFKVENSVMVAGGRSRGGGRGRDHDSGVEVVAVETKGPRHCGHYGRTNLMSDKCWDKFEKP